jgi:hypothetical protein
MVRLAVRLAVSQPDNKTHKPAHTHKAQVALRWVNLAGVYANVIMR